MIGYAICVICGICGNLFVDWAFKEFKLEKYKIFNKLLAIIFSLAFGLLTYFYALPNYCESKFDQEYIKKEYAITAYSKLHPEEYKAFIKAIAVAELNKKDKTNSAEYSSALMGNKLLKISGESMPDSSVDIFLQAQIALDKILIQKKPIVILKMESNTIDAETVNVFEEMYNNPVSRGVVKDYINAIGCVVVFANKNPGPSVNKKDAHATLDKIINELKMTYETDALFSTFRAIYTKDFTNPKINPKIRIDFYEKVLRLDSKSKGNLMRYLFSLG